MSSRIRLRAAGATAAVLVALGATPALAAGAPLAVTGNASKVGATTATLTGAIAPAGYQITYAFEYGTSTRYTSVTTPLTLPPSTAAEFAAATVTGLKPDTTYHYTVVAAIRQGYYLRVATFSGADVTFTTAAAPSSTVALRGSKIMVKRARAAVKLRCAGTAACAGTLTLTRRGTTLGSTAYSLKAGGRATVHVKLNTVALGLLRGGHTVAARCSARSSTGQTGFRNRKVKLGS